VARYDQRTARCRVYVYKDGLLSAMGHDLILEVTRFSVEIDDNRIEARFDSSSLRVFGPAVLSASDRRDIEQRIVSEVLDARRYPEIRFRGHTSELHIQGVLELHGRARSLSFDTDGPRGVRVRVSQPDFGIRPYTALLGTLRVRPDVEVEITLPSD